MCSTYDGIRINRNASPATIQKRLDQVCSLMITRHSFQRTCWPAEKVNNATDMISEANDNGFHFCRIGDIVTLSNLPINEFLSMCVLTMLFDLLRHLFAASIRIVFTTFLVNSQRNYSVEDIAATIFSFLWRTKSTEIRTIGCQWLAFPPCLFDFRSITHQALSEWLVNII